MGRSEPDSGGGGGGGGDPPRSSILRAPCFIISESLLVLEAATGEGGKEEAESEMDTVDPKGTRVSANSALALTVGLALEDFGEGGRGEEVDLTILALDLVGCVGPFSMACTRGFVRCTLPLLSFLPDVPVTTLGAKATGEPSFVHCVTVRGTFGGSESYNKNGEMR